MREEFLNTVFISRYLRFVAEQNPEVGWLMRRGLEAYYGGHMYDDLLFLLI